MTIKCHSDQSPKGVVEESLNFLLHHHRLAVQFLNRICQPVQSCILLNHRTGNRTRSFPVHIKDLPVIVLLRVDQVERYIPGALALSVSLLFEYSHLPATDFIISAARVGFRFFVSRVPAFRRI